MKTTTIHADKMTKVRSKLTNEQNLCYEHGLRVVRALESEERNLVENLIEAESLGLPKAFELSSLFAYAVEILGLTDHVTGMMINVARKSKRLPALRAAIQSKQVSVSKVHKFCSSVNESNVQDWIEFASTHSARKIEDRVREQDPSRMKSYKLKLPLSAEKLLKRVQSIESQRQRRPVSREEAIETALEFFVDRKDPVKRADRGIQRKRMKAGKSETMPTQQFTGIARESKPFESGLKISMPNQSDSKLSELNHSVPKCAEQASRQHSVSEPSRVPLTSEQRNAVLARTRGCCTYLNSRGELCGQDRWTDIHHVKPVKEGGTNDIENLTVLCWFHHDLIHQLELPLEMEAPLRSGGASGAKMHS